MTQNDTTTTESVVISVARRAVFDRQRRLWGYELFCVGNADATPSGVPADRDIPVTVAASAGVGLQQIIARKKRALVTLSEKGVLDDQAYALPPTSTTVLVDEPTFQRPGVADHLDRLHADGFAIAVPSFGGSADCAELYGLADVIGVPAEGRTRDDMARSVAAIHDHDALAMACTVDDLSSFTLCQDLGYDLFQGAFSKEPEIVHLRRVASNQIVALNLLQMLESDEQDTKALADQIQSDAAISFRLLTYLNSASIGLTHKIKSIPHAISLLGWRQVRNWLRVVLLSDLSREAANPELLPLAAQRARFLEQIGERYPFWGFEPASLNLLGLFSLLDAMIGVPMEEIVACLPIDARLAAALCREPDSEYMPLLVLAQHLEEARWSEAEDAINRLNLDSAGVRNAFAEAVAWAGEMTAMMEND